MAVPTHTDHEIDEAWLYIQSALERWAAWARRKPSEHRIGHLSDASVARGYLTAFLGGMRRDREVMREALTALTQLLGGVERGEVLERHVTNARAVLAKVAQSR